MAWYTKWAIMVMAALVYVAGQNLINWPALTPSDWGTWIGAIGTVTTLAGTIWLATAESRRRRNDEITRAHLMAAALAPRISHLRNELSAMEGSLSFTDVDTGLHRPPRIEACAFLSSTYKPATSDELILLTALGDNCANKLAYAQAQLDVFKALITNHIENVEDPGAPLKDDIGEIWLEWISGLGDRFEMIERQLVDIARIYATPPTSDELYGPDFE